jgi:hypothetical protein
MTNTHRLEAKRKERRSISKANTIYHRKEAYLNRGKPFD